jgi:large subunit ribosomal protein L19
MSHELIRAAEASSLKSQVPDFDIGDTVTVRVRIVEGGKERVQPYTGVVIARRGSGMRETFTVRRIVANEGVERIFPLHSPKVADIEVHRSGKIRRAKLYYLRDRIGKARRLKERKGKTGSAVSKSGDATASQQADEAELNEPVGAGAE